MPWYYVYGEQEVGPVSDEEFETSVRNGVVTPETEVWRDGMAEWRPYREVMDGSPGAAAPPQAPVPEFGQAQTPVITRPQTQAVPGETSPLAIASLVLGIVSFVLQLSLLAAIPAVVVGHLALKQIRTSDKKIGGRRLAIAGLIVGYLNIALTLLIVTFIIVIIIISYGY